MKKSNLNKDEGTLEELHKIVMKDGTRRSKGMTYSKGMKDQRHQRKEKIKKEEVGSHLPEDP